MLCALSSVLPASPYIPCLPNNPILKSVPSPAGALSTAPRPSLMAGARQLAPRPIPSHTTPNALTFYALTFYALSVVFLALLISVFPQLPLHELLTLSLVVFHPSPVLLASPCPRPKDRGEDVWALRELPCGSVGAVSQHTSLAPIPGSAGCPVLAPHVGNRPVRCRLVRHWLIGVKGAGRRVCGGLPPGAGAAWFSSVGLRAVVGPCSRAIRSGLVRPGSAAVAAHAASYPAASSRCFWRPGLRIVPRYSWRTTTLRGSVAVPQLGSEVGGRPRDRIFRLFHGHL